MNISCCRPMQASRFALSGCTPEAFVSGPQSDTLWLDYEGRVPEKAVAKNAVVYPGMLLARHPELGVGDLHCPVIGVVSDAGAQGVLITVGLPKAKPKPAASAEDGAAAAPSEEAKEPEIPATKPIDLGAVQGDELVRTLKELGIHTAPLTRPCTTLIINGLNPEPGMAWAESMLESHADVIRAGVALLRRLTPASSVILALGAGGGTQLADMDVRPVPAVYPSSLDPLVIKAVTGKECPDDVCAVGLHAIWQLGRVAQTGLPVAETVLTLDGVNYLVPIGTPARTLLDKAGVKLGDGDMLIFGGPMRGVAQSRPQAGVTSQTCGICVVRKDDVPPLEGDAPCIACGECVHVCPARIQPGMVSRFAELGQDAKCAALHIAACMDCGLCTYVCISRRPVLQHLRLARRRLGV